MGERILSFLLILTFFSFPQTPLHNAAREGSVECVNTLIKHGADVSAKTVRSERVCESASYKRRDVWGFVWFTDGCLFGCGGVATYAVGGKIYLSHFSPLLSLSYFPSHTHLLLTHTCSHTLTHSFTPAYTLHSWTPAHTHTLIHFFPEASWVCVLCVLLDSISQRILNFFLSKSW